MARTNIVMTVMTGLSAVQVKPFLFSARENGGPCKLVVFANRLSRETRTIVDEYADEVIDFNYLSIRMRHPQCLLWPVWKRVFARLRSEQDRRKLAHQVFFLF